MTETLLRPLSETGEAGAPSISDRRSDIEAKTAHLASLLAEISCDGLLLFEPDNFAWLTGGGVTRGLPDGAAAPVLFCNGEHRWVIASNVDSPRLFDEEIDGLGFQLKEWPWHWGRDQLLADIRLNRRIACDVPAPDTHFVGEQIAGLRRRLSPYEQACLRVLGQIVAHALEATCRNINPGDSEREIAGQLSHRLLHRGALPVHLGVAVDDRSRVYRRHGFTSTPVKQFAVVTATARKYGLIATASRTVAFGQESADLRQGHNAVCRVTASYLASTWPDAVPREILVAGRRIYLLSGFEHEWMLSPQGHLTGRSVVEMALTPQTEDLFQPGWAVTWSASAGPALSCDTFVITGGIL